MEFSDFIYEDNSENILNNINNTNFLSINMVKTNNNIIYNNLNSPKYNIEENTSHISSQLNNLNSPKEENKNKEKKESKNKIQIQNKINEIKEIKEKSNEIKENINYTLKQLYSILSECSNMKVNLIILRFKKTNWKNIITGGKINPQKALENYFKLKINKWRIHAGSIIFTNILLSNKTKITLRFYFKNDEIVIYINNIDSLLFLEQKLQSLLSENFDFGNILKLQNINTSCVISYVDFLELGNIFLNIPSNNINTDIDSSELPTGCFLNEKTKDPYSQIQNKFIQNKNKYAKIKLRLMKHLTLIYEKTKNFITFISNQIELTYKFSAFLSIFKFNNNNKNILYSQKNILNISIEQNLFKTEFIYLYQRKKIYKRKHTDLEIKNNKHLKLQEKYYTECTNQNIELSNDINKLILFQNYLELFKLLQTIKLICTPICNILLELLNHPINGFYDSTILNTQLIKDFLKQSSILPVLKSKKNNKIYEKIFNKKIDSVKILTM